VRVAVCFVCLGNICRSPTAEGVFRALVQDAGLGAAFSIESAGTGAWHEGERPDRRARAAAARRGIAVDGSARQFTPADFEAFDYVIAMDRENLRELQALAPNGEARLRITLLRAFDPAAPADSEVPDPYYGEGDGFERVIDICAAGCRGLLDALQRDHSLEA